MNVVTALMVIRLLTRNQLGEPEGIPFGSMWWFIYAGVSFFIVIFAGLMSGLTIGLMSLNVLGLHILESSGSPSQKTHAAVILPVVQKQHQLLVTLVMCNAAAIEYAPMVYIDSLALLLFLFLMHCYRRRRSRRRRNYVFGGDDSGGDDVRRFLLSVEKLVEEKLKQTRETKE